MNQLTQWGPIAIIIGGYLLGINFQNRSIAHLERRIGDFRDAMNKRFDDSNNSTNKRFDDMNRRFDDVNRRFDDFRDLLKSEVKRIEERLERLEHPVIQG